MSEYVKKEKLIDVQYTQKVQILELKKQIQGQIVFFVFYK